MATIRRPLRNTIAAIWPRPSSRKALSTPSFKSFVSQGPNLLPFQRLGFPLSFSPFSCLGRLESLARGPFRLLRHFTFSKNTIYALHVSKAHLQGPQALNMSRRCFPPRPTTLAALARASPPSIASQPSRAHLKQLPPRLKLSYIIATPPVGSLKSLKAVKARQGSAFSLSSAPHLAPATSALVFPLDTASNALKFAPSASLGPQHARHALGGRHRCIRPRRPSA